MYQQIDPDELERQRYQTELMGDGAQHCLQRFSSTKTIDERTQRLDYSDRCLEQSPLWMRQLLDQVPAQVKVVGRRVPVQSCTLRLAARAVTVSSTQTNAHTKEWFATLPQRTHSIVLDALREQMPHMIRNDAYDSLLAMLAFDEPQQPLSDRRMR